MSDMKLIRFTRVYLWFWAAVAGIFFTYVNWYGGKDLKYHHWYNLNHFVWALGAAVDRAAAPGAARRFLDVTALRPA